MIHINATLTFNKYVEEDMKSLSIIKDTLFTYNLMAIQCGASPIPSEECDCYDKIEMRFDFDYNGKGACDMLDMANKFSAFGI